MDNIDLIDNFLHTTKRLYSHFRVIMIYLIIENNIKYFISCQSNKYIHLFLNLQTTEGIDRIT